ncbi:MAG: OmpA family protein [Acidobacteria bacterium]|jgi:peptidoglycan-associated lipoprotein|nr:OmpA family protein [Acidobacteriota bacterium]
MRRIQLVATLTLIAAASTACATKGFVNTRLSDVNTRVGGVDTKVDALSSALEDTQAQAARTEGRLSEVDRTATAAQTAAADASDAAGAANAKAQGATDAATAVERRTDAMAAASRRLIFEVVLNEDQGQFKFNAVELPDAVKARLDELVNQIKADPKGIYFEVEGHTDSTGPESINERIGLERADAVKRYLYEAHQVPLHKVSIISFGEARPVAPNTTRDGRAQNRRVVIRVLV